MGNVDINRKPATLYLHVGRGRTGTSSLQVSLSMSRATLAEHGFAYPAEPGIDPSGRPRGVGNGSWLAIKIAALPPSDGTWRDQFREWLAGAIRPEMPNVVVSSEFFWNMPSEHLERMRDVAASLGLSTVPVAYLREQVSHMISVYCQRVRKGKEVASLQDYLAHRAKTLGRNGIGSNGIYDAVLANLEAVFGNGNVLTGMFARAHLVDADIRTDFFAKLGLPKSAYHLAQGSANESAGVVETELLRRLNAKKALFAPDGRKLFNLARARGITSSRDFEAQVPEDTRAKIRDYYSDSNERTRQRYFPNSQAPLFDAKLSGQPLTEADIQTRSLQLFELYEQTMLKGGAGDFASLRTAVFEEGPVSSPAAPRAPALVNKAFAFGEPVSLDELGHKYQTDKASGRHNYLDAYETVLASKRQTARAVLEIGVKTGASVRMWRDYFANAHIIGVDLNPACIQQKGDRISVHIGSQVDTAFLDTVIRRRQIDVIVDDGSHLWSHQIESFKHLWPHLQPGGVYIVEDLHASLDWQAGKSDPPDAQTAPNYFARLARFVAARAFDPGEAADPAIEAVCRTMQQIFFGPRYCIMTKRFPRAAVRPKVPVAARLANFG